MLKRGFQFAPGYRLQEFLGRGQFGQVWRATAPGGAAMAAKFIDLSDGQGQKEYEGVKRVKQIRHANLMPITALWLLDGEGKVIEEAPDDINETIDVSVVESKGRSAIVLPPKVDPSWLVVGMLLGGKSLQQRLRECVTEGMPGIPPKELLAYLDESAKGLDFLNSPQHDLGEGPIAIQHSDVKPANIVLIGSSAVVCDFGLARILTRNQVTATSAAGTPAYMAPEAISGKPSRHSDQYSLAVTYYHLRTGTLPVSDGSLWEVLDAHRHGKLNLSAVSEAEQAVIRKATHLQWDQRFESCLEMVDAMRDALRAEGHTKPSFVASDVDSGRRGQVRPGVGDPSVGVPGDAARGSLEDSPALMQTADSVENQSLDSSHAEVETAHFEPGGESTRKEGFANEALPTLAENPPVAENEAPSQEADSRHAQRLAAWREAILANPLIASVALVAFVLVLGVAGWKLTHSGDATPETLDRDLLTEALAAWDQDEAESVRLFQQALETEQPPTLSSKSLTGLKGPVMRLATIADGSKLVGFADGPTAFAWNLNDTSTKGVPLSGHLRLINALVMHPVEALALTGGVDATARIWKLDATDLSESALTLEGHNQPVEAVAWHPVEPVAVTTSADLTMRLWSVNASGKVEAANPKQSFLPIQEHITSLATDPQGRWLAGITLGEDLVDPNPDVLLYPWNSLLEKQGVPSPIRLGAASAKHIAFLDGAADEVLVCGERGGSLAFYSVASGDLLGRSPVHQDDVEALCVVSDLEHPVIVSAGADGTVNHLRYDDSAKSTRRVFSPSGISCVDVSDDGRWVAAGSGEGTVWLWDTTVEGDGSRGALQIDAQCGSVDSVVIDEPEQMLIVGGDDGVIRIYDLKMARLMTLASPTPTISGETREVTLPKISMRID